MKLFFNKLSKAAMHIHFNQGIIYSLSICLPVIYINPFSGNGDIFHWMAALFVGMVLEHIVRCWNSTTKPLTFLEILSLFLMWYLSSIFVICGLLGTISHIFYGLMK